MTRHNSNDPASLSPMYTDFAAAILLLLTAVPLAAVVVAAGYWAYRQRKLGNEQVSEQR